MNTSRARAPRGARSGARVAAAARSAGGEPLGPRPRRRPDPLVPPEQWSEAQLQTAILNLCADLDDRLRLEYPGDPSMRLLVFHDEDSKRNVRGFPDLVIAGPGGHILAELKADATRGRLRPEQEVWLEVLTLGGAPAYEWRTADWISGAIQRELYRLARPVRTLPATPARGARQPRPRPAPAMRCGCPVGVAPDAHTCEVWGPPS